MSTVEAPAGISAEERAAAYGFQRVTLPNGQGLWYHEARHAYFRDVKAQPDGKVTGVGRLTGVSTVVKPFDWAPDALMGWAARLNVDGLVTLAAEGLGCDDADDMLSALRFLQTPESAWAALDDAGLLYSQARDDAARRGTNIHRLALHAMATGAKIPALSELTEEERGYARGVIAFWHDHDPEAVHSELFVADLDGGIAGRLDLIYCTRDGVVVLDAKTVSKVPAGPSDRLPYSAQHVQLAGYKKLADLSGVDGMGRTEVLQVFPDGTYRLVEGQATEADFDAAVGVYRAAARVQRDARASAKAAA